MPTTRAHLIVAEKARSARSALVLCAVLASCASEDLGECDMQAAEEIVYSELGMAATKGQALTHDSCGNGVFCHSTAAKGGARNGAPSDMNFDMLPSPAGLVAMLEHSGQAWNAVVSDTMPPRGVGNEVQGDGHWTTDPQGRSGAVPLAPITTEAGKAAFRNWLACGAPTVTDTAIPAWALPPVGFEAGEIPAWSKVYDVIMKPRCAVAGCHNATGVGGGLAMGTACETHDALLGSAACGGTYVRPFDADGSLLVAKLEESDPECGDPMPPPSQGGQLPETWRAAVRAWIDAGALAEECP